MRLIRCDTLELEEFFSRPVPDYYILSHRWTDDETTYQDFKKGRRKASRGCQKILECCRFVFEYHRSSSMSDTGKCYVWIDTCCIDKKSSAELSEAINSMYQYYTNAIRCYVFLSDVNHGQDLGDGRLVDSQFDKSEWFTRGWTLQELIAPQAVVFLDETWQVIGHKCRRPQICTPGTSQVSEDHCGAILNDQIAHITGIDAAFIATPSKVHTASIACRMSWASRRRTTRTEDVAYCLLGILGVNMPLLYGEGQKAFFRLQEELIKRSTDQSIFAWTPNKAEHASLPDTARVSGIFARSPADFEYCGNVLSTDDEGWPYTITNTGLDFHTAAQNLTLPGALHQSRLDLYIITLNCYIFERSKNGPGWSSTLAKIALIEIPKSLRYHQLQNKNSAPVRLFQRLHDMDDLLEDATVMGGAKRVQLYVKTFDEVTFLFQSDLDLQ